MKKWILVFAFLLASFCSMTAAGETNTFTFVPEQSTVVQTGGIAGVHETYSIEEQFQLTVDFDAGIASFDEVDANLTNGSIWLYTRDLGVLFNMTELAGTVLSDTTIEFEGETADGTNTEIHILVTLAGNSAHLIGETTPPCCDFFIYYLDAVALVHPTTYYVNAVNGDDNNDGLSPETAFATIQKGIDTAEDGDTIIVQPGRYTESINFLGKNITLTSTNPMYEGIVNSTIIDGNDVNSVVIFSGTESSDCVLRGFTITNGEAPEGGGIYGNGTLATIENNIIIGNEGVGYGVPGSYGTGGGLLDCDGLIQNNIITENYAGFGGGAAGCDGRIKNNIISYNGWYAGGGLDFCGGEISNNLLVGNMAVYGGALSCCNGIIRNCTVVGNWATYGSGLEGCNESISNCIIWKNGAGIWTQIVDCSTPVYSCIEDWTGAGTGNTSADPCFANIGYWQQQGSIWRWVENGADYHLRSQAGRWDPNSESWVQDDVNSPCIDAGDPNSDWTVELWPHGKRINMGAYGGTPQASMSLSDEGNVADLNNDDSVDYKDLKLFTDKWLNQQVLLPEDLNRDGVVDFSDFAIFARQRRGNNYILLKIYSDGWGNLLETATMEEEGQITILVYEEEPYSYPAARYYVYASRDGYYTEIYYCEAFGSPPTNFITVDVDLDPIVPEKFNGVIFMTQWFFSDRYLPNTDVTVKEGDTVVNEFQTDHQGRFATEIEPGNYDFEFISGQEYHLEPVSIGGQYQDFFFPDHAQAFKPSIYIYPEETIELDIDIVFPHGGQITTSIPDYNDGWHITVEPSGIIDGQFEYLFYESVQPDYGQYAAGWVVIREQLEDFFRNNMGQTGFNQKEIDDFIEYWIPILTEYPCYAIYPQYRGELEEMIKLEFSAQPESLIRLIYSVRGLEDNNLNIQEPVIPPFTRDGFTVTEWGVILK